MTTKLDAIRNAANLASLLDALNAVSAEEQTLEYDRLASDIPNYGGEAPDDAAGIYSWDAQRLLVVDRTTGALKIVPRPVRCECGDIYGEACEAEVEEGEAVAVEYMPAHLRASHLAAGNRGAYPANGAQRLTCCRACADRILESEADWASEVEEEPSADYHATRIETGPAGELVAYGHRMSGCAVSGCAGYEMRLGEIRPEQTWRDEDGEEWATIGLDDVQLPTGTLALVGR